MSDDQNFAQLEELAVDLKRFVEQIQPYVPSVQFECRPASAHPIDLYLGAWNGAQFAETFLKTVNPGETFSLKLAPIMEFSEFKKGHSLMMRNKKGVSGGIYTLKNLESYAGYALAVLPAVYPWWQPPAKIVRWGPEQPYLVQPLASLYADIVFDEEHVFYYFRIG